MEIGIDSFAAMFSSMPQQPLSDQDAVEQLLARMKLSGFFRVMLHWI